ncbi:TonB-dependent receptor plug domain-containing protein [Thioflexithrix psekupsensis]|uniref:TonB-dependent receptor plug domain-containing protein n=1 Tax=Thioflexithrix psekupsensis TaxID=1570016 RepID=UPI000A3CB20B|nr:TonB-dependent receptor plug domain-containing protein [Thioflexithrix psekupsensis]
MTLFYPSSCNKFITVLALSAVFNVAFASQIDLDKLKTMDLADLLNITIETASGVEEKLFDAPATMVVVTAEQIAQRGYHHLTEVLQDLPGFDVVIANGAFYSNSYQRGYRLPTMSRTLLMIDGVVDNLLWSQEATISRQYPLSNIQRIEVLYGPASAIYGPNAFLGVINLITKNGSELEKGQIKGEINALMGSFNSKGAEVTLRGRPAEELSFSLAAKLFHSDEADLTGRWGFTNAEQLANRDIWGPILDLEHQGKRFGEYHDPTEDYGVIASVNYKGLKLGVIHWRLKEGYGAFYASDRTQPNTFWSRDNDQLYVDYKKSPHAALTLTSHISYQKTHIHGYWAEA